MSVRSTTPSEAALYDAVKMRAFGPIFESSAHADDFVAWVTAEWGVQNLPALPGATLDRLHTDWAAARCTEEGDLIAGGAKRIPKFFDAEDRPLKIGSRVDTDDYGVGRIVDWVEPDESHWGIEVAPAGGESVTIWCGIRDYAKEGPDPDGCDMSSEEIRLVAP